MDRREAGRRGERLAARFLSDRGYTIVDRNVHLRHAELDLVALDGGALCFIEVRLRRGDRFGSPEESVDRRKRLRIARAAAEYLATRRTPTHRSVRFDVVGIVASVRGDAPTLRLVRDAFRVGD